MKSKEEGKKSKKVRFATDYHRRSWITCGVSRRLARGNRRGYARVCALCNVLRLMVRITFQMWFFVS